MKFIIDTIERQINLNDHGGGINFTHNLVPKSIFLFLHTKNNPTLCASQICYFGVKNSTSMTLNSEIVGINNQSSTSKKLLKKDFHLPFTKIFNRNVIIEKKYLFKAIDSSSINRKDFVTYSKKKLKLIHRNLLESKFIIYESLKLPEQIN